MYIETTKNIVLAIYKLRKTKFQIIIISETSDTGNPNSSKSVYAKNGN